MSKSKAILYARVSTRAQAGEDRFSLPQQLHALREYAEENVLEVVEEIADPGFSGATLERPGLDRVRDLVAGGGISVVLAQDGDRFSREIWHYGYLAAEFEEYGTKLRALDDRDDGTPEGKFFADMHRGMKKLEREYIKRRTQRGRLQRARQGNVIAGNA